MILVVPHVRNNKGQSIEDSQVQKVRIYIAEKGKAPVAGHDNIGIFNPDYEIYEVTISIDELTDRKIDLSNVAYIDSSGQSIDSGIADKIQFTCKEGIEGSVAYIDHADYYDISDIKLPVEQLPPARYILTYEATYFSRSISKNDELLCVDTDGFQVATYRFLLNHPGEVILSMVEKTPSLYFNQKKKSEDDTIAFYRPFSEPLQDIYDEQNYLERANWVYNIPPEHVPYLGFLLGWELPYFPASVDSLRRAVLRNMVRLQQLKGTKRAVRELFDLFGFAVSIGSVWWTPDGGKYAGPGEQLAGNAYEIGLQQKVTTEPLLLEFVTNGFGQATVPLIHRQVDNKITVRAYVVERGSAAHDYLRSIGSELSEDFDALDYDPPSTYTQLDSSVSNVESLDGLVGGTTATIASDGYVQTISTVGEAPVSKRGLKHDFVTNVMDIGLGRYYNFESEGTAFYVFASYIYDDITVPNEMKDLQSNRFDITIVKKDGEQVDPDVILFLVDFLFRIKAFHSLLRRVIITLLSSDTYQVTDFCVGGEVEQDIDVDAGKQQVPPEAITPATPGDCFAYTPEDYGFRRWDIEYRDRVLRDLKIEFDAWSDLSSDCAYNKYGQDRSQDSREQSTILENSRRLDEDDERETLCKLDGNDYCYLGRPRDSITEHITGNFDECWRFKPCDLGIGTGVYYTYPRAGFLKNPVVAPYLDSDPSSAKFSGLLASLLRAYGTTQKNSIHFSTDPSLDHSDIRHRWLGIQRGPLCIQHDNLNFPGHRFPGLGALLDDYEHSLWRAKPHDYDVLCKDGSSKYPNPLDATLELDSKGNKVLSYDDQPYSIEGNGQLPDIYTLGEHRVDVSEVRIDSADDVTHAIYIGQISDGHPAINLDGAVEATGTVVVPDGEGAFMSATECGGQTIDFADGYPADYGFLDPTDIPTVDYFPAVGVSEGLADALDIPTAATDATLLFTLISQIKVPPSSFEYDYYRHLRLDCGCLELDCDDITGGSNLTDVADSLSTRPSLLDCPVDSFLNEYGSADNDQIEYDQTMVLVEQLFTNVEGIADSGSSLFSLKQIFNTAGWSVSELGDEGPSAFPPEGSFSYKDDYDTIHEVHWETIGHYLDFVVVTKEPRVWGVSYKTGRLVNREIYRRGIITTSRQIFVDVGDGNYQLAASASEQVIGEFQSTYLCNSPFTDPFVLHLSHNMQDTVGWAVICGSHWTDPGDDSSENVVWTDVSGPGAGEQPLTWVDVFGEHDLTAVCG